MNENIKKYLSDILNSIHYIDIHLANKRNFNLYTDNLTIKRAVEREMGIIGEAVTRILKENKDFPLAKAREIIAFRNRVIHAYDAVDDNLVWKIIIKDLPDLERNVKELLN